VLKPAIKLKESDLNSQIEVALRGLVARVPFLNLTSLKCDVKLGDGGIGRADWLAELEAGDQSWALVAEGKRSGQPREVRAAVLQLKHYLSLLPPGKPSWTGDCAVHFAGISRNMHRSGDWLRGLCRQCAAGV